MANLAHANRGNVAVICWNTLNSKTWYVKDEDLDGNVSLGSDDQSLLAINFADFTTEADGSLKEIEEVTLTKDNIDGQQLILRASDVDFADEFQKVPSKNKDEKSYKTTADLGDKDKDNNSVETKIVRIYVPENVCEDLSTLRNKTVTIILGEDNVAALITVEDDVVDTAFLTKYDDDKITVDGETYKLAKNLVVYLNDAKADSLEDALDDLKVANYKDIEKKIEATMTLDDDDRVKTLDLFASADLDNTAEVVVKKVKETSKAYTIYTTGSDISWKLDDEDKNFDFPTVYVDGKIADIRDIEAGNVLTVIMEEKESDIKYGSDKEISKIYASTKSVTGEATRVKKSNNAITVDGDVYTATRLYTETDKVMTKDEIKDGFDLGFKTQTILDNDEVTLYLNIFGEYVAIALEEANSNYTFGVVTYVSSNITWDGEDEEIAVRNFKVLLPDGTKKTFKLTVDTDDDDTKAFRDFVVKNDEVPFGEGSFVMFDAKDNVIELEDGDEVIVLAKVVVDGNEKTMSLVANKGIHKDYVIAEAKTPNRDDEEFKADYGATKDIDAEYNSSVVIFNTVEKEIVSKWNSIVKANDTFEDTKTFAIFEDEDDDTPLYIVVGIADGAYSSSDSQYAIVKNSAYKEGNKNYVDLVGNENLELKEAAVLPLTDIDNAFVEYEMSSSRVSNAAMLVDVDEFNDLAAEDYVKVGILNDGFETKLVLDKSAITANIKAVTGEYNENDLFTDAVELENVAMYTIEKLFPVSAKKDDKFKVIQENATLTETYPNDAGLNAGKKTKTYTVGTDVDAGEDYALLVKNDVKATVKVYEVASDATETLIATYVINPTVTTKDVTKTEVVANTQGFVKEHFIVDEVKSYKDYVKVSYKDYDDDYELAKLPNVKLDDDTVVYDLTSGEIKEITLKEFEEMIAEGVYAIPFRNADCDEEANILVVFAE